ncbi:MAG: Protein of unknown function (DUF1553)/Protein of unknown function (DUF1549)/Planctomycete [Pedosphaera sp.]|nr:Protein of unknown function (DUF1553)/Protein of unknown function (DUF1549)/Planctomycete [Pedosphaera sp.]
MRKFTGLILIFTICLTSLCLRAATISDSLPKVIQFNRDIRPILSDNCFSCHGPDKNKRKAKLQLDTKEGLLAEIEGRHPVVPGKPDQSEIYRRIISSDPEEVMPQNKSGKTLTPRQVALIKRWIEQGAKWEGHWAYNPPVRPAVPHVKKTSWSKTPVDNFILSRLETEKLQPSAEADRRILIRRLSFDLIGLPPTPEEVQAFINDKTPQAYEKLVDRLLASPHYGERMAMSWLDEVRYADTDGFHADNYRSVYPYRDYVIAAFNTNMPFNQFTIEQLAGDLLPNATISQKIASTYNKLNRTTEEGGAQAKEYLAKYAADRVRTTSTTWMGATMACCECHDHKFDPYSTRDFYSFEAFFADIKEQGVAKPEAVPVPNEQQTAELKKMDQEIANLQKALDTATPELATAQLEWEKEFSDQAPPKLSDWHSVGPFTAQTFEGTFKKPFEPEKEVDLSKSYHKGKDKWIAHPEWTDGKVYNGLKGDNSATYLYRTIEVQTSQSLTLLLGSDDGIKVWLNGKEVLSNQIMRGAAPDQEKVTVRLQAGENKLLLKIVNGAGDSGFYFKTGDHAPDNILAILKVESGKRNEAQNPELAKYYRTIAPALDSTRAELAAAKKRQDDFTKSLPTTLATTTVEPRVTRVLPRGNWMSEAGDIVTPAVPAFLNHSISTNKRANRLDLAQWLVARDNPLTARVFVNRLWKTFYGTGLSKTLDDTGSRGEWPTHPELLDWLATEFMDSGWDVKHMVKLMVMANTYRQTSVPDEKLRERDPANRLFARQSSFRLDAEFVRDNALSVSGLLADKIGGPSVKPYQPAGYWDQLNFPKRTYENDKGAAQYRRGLYSFWCRTFLQPSMLAFDAPPREECTVERVYSNTPLQALALLNDPTYVEAARVLAERIMRDGGSSAKDRINWTFARTLNRKPSDQEFKLLNDLYQEQIEHYSKEKADADKLLTEGEAPAPKDINTPELAAWTSVSRTVLNLHETITRY